ncbi:MAG: GHKL domain-containing protein [Chloroflexi bacterium]|nr:GHKL domain-containing protein [Chloroflexota bacterium]
MLVFWRRTIGYIGAIAGGIDWLLDPSTNVVALPSDLREVEGRLHQVRYDLLRNQQLASEAEQRKNDLIVYLAHDLKTPLTSVIGYLSLLCDERHISEELRRKYLSIALAKAEKLEDLINEFFEITRFSLKDLTLDPARINLTRMIEQIADEFKPLLAPKGLSCSVTADQDITISGDASKLERVFDNLIRNAIAYSHENGEIVISGVRNEQGVTIRVRNQGDTIPEHQLKRIFEQFYRLDASRNTASGGAGLGLAIAKEIVELHQGTLTASSENGMIELAISLPA